jgi:hypothetical protein
MIYNLVNLDDEFSGMAQKSVGFTGADLNTTNATITSTVDGGSALDQIQKIAFAVPDLMNTTWIVDMCNQHAWIAKDMFFVCLILSVIAWLLGQAGASRPENEAYLIVMLKRSVIAFAMRADGAGFDIAIWMRDGHCIHSWNLCNGGILPRKVLPDIPVLYRVDLRMAALDIRSNREHGRIHTDDDTCKHLSEYHNDWCICYCCLIHKCKRWINISYVGM